ncbi:hypothetical protein RN001_008533 [Aquatica leii]|uniref:Uncharacterized protein n=1 Tax=Aquatica leii TaxID=1421715 RepID=A0AAN7PZ83_9COLE|nr:hypothetical protein RN001_008533 [Aquatica leii]
MANISIINVYAPTEVATNEKKDIFYETIESTCQKISKHDTVILLRDLNAMIGKEEHIQNVAGKETLHGKTNDNGTRLCNLTKQIKQRNNRYDDERDEIIKEKREARLKWIGTNKDNYEKYRQIRKDRIKLIKKQEAEMAKR